MKIWKAVKGAVKLKAAVWLIRRVNKLGFTVLPSSAVVKTIGIAREMNHVLRRKGTNMSRRDTRRAIIAGTNNLNNTLMNAVFEVNSLLTDATADPEE